MKLYLAQPEFYPKSKHRINSVKVGSSLLVKLRNLTFPKLHHLLPLNDHMAQKGRVLVALVKRHCRIRQSHKSKPLIFVVTNDSDATIADADPFVWVSDCDVERKVVVEGGGVGDTELGQKGIGDCDLSISGKYDDPYEKQGYEWDKERTTAAAGAGSLYYLPSHF